MNRNRILPLLAGLAMLALLQSSSCIQVVKLVSLDLGVLSAVNGASSAGKYVDLVAENSTYRDHKQDFEEVDDLAVLGTFKNNTATPVSAQVWIVTSPSNSALLPDRAAVQAAGGVMAWTMKLNANETKTLTWDNSAAAFTIDGKNALANEIAGDAKFTLYVFGSTATYDITITHASFDVMIGGNFGP